MLLWSAPAKQRKEAQARKAISCRAELLPLLAAPSIQEHARLACATPVLSAEPSWFDPSLQGTLDFLAASSVSAVLRRREVGWGRLQALLRDVPRGDPAWPASRRFKVALEAYGYSDVAAADLLDPAVGAPIVGITPGPEHWPIVECAHVPPEAQLWARARDSPGDFASRAKPSQWDAQLLASTRADLRSGKVLGPFDTYAELCTAVGGTSTPALRFGVDQGLKADGSKKIRPCDDFTGDGKSR